LADPPIVRLRWEQTFRIVPSRYPPIPLFERVADPADWDRLAALAIRTDPRLRDEWGEISLVPPARRVAGPGASHAMAPFTHLNPNGSRFSDGQFGVYYASNQQEGAIAETVHHMAAFYRATSDPPHREDMRVLIGQIDADLHDIRTGADWEACHAPEDYSESRALARTLRAAGSNGIVYRSVRRAGAENFGAFWPDVVSCPIEASYLQYDWDGSRIGRYFDFSRDLWVAL
jgi:hypothetical protein